MTRIDVPYPARPAAIYIRVSSKEQAADGKYSLESQLDENRAKLVVLAVSLGTRPDGNPAVYGDTYTGTQVERPGAVYNRQGELIRLPGMDMLVAEAGRYSVVSVLDRTRLGRRQAVSSQIRQQLSLQGAVLRYCHGDITTDRDTDLMLDAMGDVMSELELRHLQRRMAAGRRRRFESKRLPYGQVPFGYTMSDKDSVPEQVPEEAATIRLVAELFLKGWPVHRIALDPRIQNRQRRTFSENSLKNLVKNPFYAGLLAWGWSRREPDIVLVGQHKPVFSAEEWALLQIERQRRRSVRSQGVISKWPYSGILRCDNCKSCMISCVSHGQSYYRCPSRYRLGAIRHKDCPPNHVSERAIREAVLARLRELVSDTTFEDWQDSGQRVTAADLQERLDALTKQEANLWRLQADAGETSEGFLAALEELRRERIVLHGQLAKLASPDSGELSLEERRGILRRDFADHLEDLVTPPFHDVLAARAVLRQLIPAIWVRAGKIVRVE